MVELTNEEIVALQNKGPADPNGQVDRLVKCVWVRAFDGNFNIGCANTTGQRANGHFKGKEMGAKWEFVYCPYCGREIDLST